MNLQALIQPLQQLLVKNLKWIIFVAIILIGTNLLTGITINRFSKKDSNQLSKKLDSLKTSYKQLELIHVAEIANRRKIFLEDSLLKIKYTTQANKDKNLIILQKQALNKFKNLSYKVTLNKLDSAYEAEN